MKVGIISDTHNLLRPEVVEMLSGCEVILHAGDISSQRILDRLEKIAPVLAVRGNNDMGWADHLPLYLKFQLAGKNIFMTHMKYDFPKNTSAFDLVVFGHSHRYEYRKEGNTVFLNPGSCGPGRFTIPATMAIAEIDEDGIRVRRIEIPRE